jgi:beta-N-acetylhexosaminidase
VNRHLLIARNYCLALLLAASLWSPLLIPAHAQPDRLERIMQRLTLDQRVGQLFMVSFSGPLNERARDFLRTMQPGAFALFSSNGTTPEAVTRFVNDLQDIALQNAPHLPMIMAIDHEGGTVRRLRDGFSDLPWGPALSSMPTEDAAAVGGLAAQELRAVGVTMNLAPVADVRSDPTKRFMENRSFGNDPKRVGGAVAAYARGLQAGQVIAVLKHFPGHGAADDSHAALPAIVATREQLAQTEFAPFKMGIEAGAEAVMLGHLVVPAYEPRPDWPSSLSETLINDVLRSQLGFDGLVMTDALDMGAIVDNVSQPEAAVLALQAGVDMIVSGPHTSITSQLAMKSAVLTAVSEGRIGLRRIDEAARRVLALKLKYGILDWRALDPRTATSRVGVDSHAAAINRIYLKTVAIAKDERQQLPIAAGRPALIVFPGAYPAAQRQCLALAPWLRSFAYSLNPTPTEIAQAVTSARDVEVAVVFTYNIRDYRFQRDLVNALPPDKLVVVAMENPYDIEEGIAPGSYVTAFNAYPGAISASCAVLFGAQTAVGTWQVGPRPSISK